MIDADFENINIIIKYFPDLTILQKEQFNKLKELYTFWNSQINVISRNDIDHLYEKHVLHSLGIAKVISFNSTHRVMDVGTGGGFPGIPLAILFPETQFYLIDSIGKKIKVVQAVIDSLQLKNVKAQQIRSEQVEGRFNFVVSRAVTDLPAFINMIKGKLVHQGKLVYLKGGDITEELKLTKRPYKVYPLSNYFEEPNFETKMVVVI
ncbi:MAG: 16S rRNA (guanine(527)-N(7))-methyltransferase [Bacteroidetes bacterium RIFCSPLOWO2_12_FULL_31_6]|nr:MAG: 16S rRNA (guanine(527)-N(7))-methyltransferase [Bacteroidetes bacterium RIFCSPLOWO2_12_FULL_31_6]